MKGKFIVIEGCDFTGKSTVIEKLVNAIELGGIKPVPTKALGGTEYGKKCRDYVMKNSGKVPNSVILDKMIKAMQDINEKIVSHAQKRGFFVICDRYYHSTLVYQGMRKNALEMVERQLSKASLIDPDLTIILDCDTSVILERMKARAETNSYDPKTAEEVDEIRNAYLEIAEMENTVMIDTTNLTTENVIEKILGFI
jgi:dTMP kinase